MASPFSPTPDPSIEEIEAELLKAKFAQHPAEKMLSDRAKQRMREADIEKAKDERVKAAFLTGYRLASKESNQWQSFFLGAWLSAIALLFLVVVAVG